MADLSFLDEYDKAKANDLKFLDDYDKIKNPSLGTKVGNAISDIGVTTLKSAVGVPELGLGLADIPTGGRAGKFAQDLGFDARKTKEYLDTLYSPRQQQANQAVNQAEGFVPTLKAYAQNPSTLFHNIGEQALPILTGGGISQGLRKLAPSLSAPVAGAAGEALVTAGQNIEQVRQESPNQLLDFNKQTLPILASSALTGGIAAGSGKLAQKLGYSDLENVLAGGARQAGSRNIGRIENTLASAGLEGITQELPQSLQEQVAINYANDKPLAEGVGSAAAQGLLLGGAMGGATGLAQGPLTRAANKVINPAPEPTGEANVTPTATGQKFDEAALNAAINEIEGQAVPGTTQKFGQIVTSENVQEQSGIQNDSEFQDVAIKKAVQDEINSDPRAKPQAIIEKVTEILDEQSNKADKRDNMDVLRRRFESLDGSTALPSEQGYLAGSNGNGENQLSLLRKQSNLADNIEANPITDYITSRQKALEAGLFDDEQSNIVKNRIAILSAIDPEQTDDAAKALKKSLEVESKYNIFVPETQKEPAIKADILPTKEKTYETIQNAYERNANEESRKGQEEALLTPTHRLYDGTLVRQEEDRFTTLDGKNSYSKDESVEALTKEEIKSYKESPVTQDATPKAKPELNDGQLFEQDVLDEKEKAKAQDSGIASGEQLFVSDTGERPITNQDDGIKRVPDRLPEEEQSPEQRTDLSSSVRGDDALKTDDVSLAKETEQPYTLNSGRNEFSKKEVDILFNDPQKHNVSRETYQAKETFDGSGKYNLLPIKQDERPLAPERNNELPVSQETRVEGTSSLREQELKSIGQQQGIARTGEIGKELPEQQGQTSNYTQFKEALNPILSQTKQQYVKEQAKAQNLKVSSPGFSQAKARIENQYEESLDKALAESSFDTFSNHPVNKDIKKSPSLLLNTYNDLRNNQGLSTFNTTEEAANASKIESTIQPDASSITQSEIRQESGNQPGTIRGIYQGEQREEGLQGIAGEGQQEKITPKVITEEDYLSQSGFSKLGIGESALHKNKGNLRDNQWSKIVSNQSTKDSELIKNRDVLRKEYQDKINSGELRAPTLEERRISLALGNPDLEQTQAARRLLEKKGIDWNKYQRDPVNYVSKKTDNLKFSKSESPQFYSQLRRSFESAPDKVFATGKQAKAWMQSNAPKLGVKSDEIYWSGIEDYLDANPKANKQDVIKYLDENGVKTEDVVLKENVIQKPIKKIKTDSYENYWIVDYEDGEKVTFPIAKADDKAEAEAYARKINSTTKHNNEKLTLPGGTNYQETVVTIPTTEKFNESDSTHFGDVGQGKQIAWMRHNDRTDANGNKVLFLEEIQSQRGQEGRKKGFEVSDAKIVQMDSGKYTLEFKDGARMGEYPTQEAAKIGQSKYKNEGVPPSPFVTDSNNKATHAYISLLMKKAVMKAVENGQDHVAWTTGTQQQDRYDISKQVDTIDYIKSSNGNFSLGITDEDGQGVALPKEEFTPEELPDVVGKDIAEKIISGQGQPGGGRMTLRGVDLRMGGEWANSMYGNEQGLDANGSPSLITKAARDIAKKFGGQIGTVKLDTGNQPAIIITPQMKAKILGEGVPLFSKDNTYKVKPPKVLYRGTNKTGEFRGATLGKGLYTTKDKKFASKFGSIEEISPQDAWPRNPLVLPNAYSGAADALNDWVIQNTEYKNIRDFNKKYSDPSVFLKEKGYDGVIAGDEVVYYGSNILTSKKHKPTGSTKEQVHSWLDAKDKEHVKSGKLNIAETKADIPKGLVSVDANGVEGFYDPKGKKVWVVAENVNKDTVRSVLNHEYLHASLNENPRLNERLMKAHSDMRTLFNDVEKGAYTGKYKEVYDAALRRVDRAKTRQEDRYEEFLAYAITEHSKSPRSLPEKIAKAVQNIIASIKSAIFKYSGYIGKISPADLTALARSSMSSKGMLDNSGKDNPLASINAWHGSPHDHNKFDSANIGTGEGAQAYGYGHYFTDKKDIAEYYKNSITKNDDITITGKFDKSFFDDFDSPINDVKSSISNLFRNEASKPGYLKEIADNESYLGRLASGILNKTIIKNQGRIYQVELAPNENELLDWDKPLNYQSDKIKSFIEKIGYLTPWDGNENKITGWKIAPDISSRSVDILNPKGERVRTLQNTKVPGNLFEKVLVKEAKEIADKMFNPNGMSLGRDIYNLFSKTKGGDKKASDYLHSIGIRGIKYKADAGQSDAYNYVIFSDDDINITNKYSIKDDVKDFLTQSSNVISLADMDTVLKTGKMPRTQYDYQQFKDKAATLLVDSTRPFDVDMRKFPNVNDVAKVINAKDLAKGKTSALEKEAMRDFVQPLAEKIKALTKTTGFEFRAVQQIIGEWMSARYAIEKNGDYIRQDQKAVDDAQEALDVDPTNSQLKSELTKAKNNQQKRLDAINEQKWIDAKVDGLSAPLAGGYNNFTAKEQMLKYEKLIPKKDLEEAAKHIYDLMKWKVDLDLKTGKVTQEQVDKWFKSPYYVPLTGDPSVDSSEDDLFQHGGVNQAGDKAAKGRQKSKAQSGIDAAIEQVQKSTRYAGWNDFKDALNNLYNNLIQEELDNGATMREAISNVKDQYNIVKKPISNDAMLPSTAITYRKNGKNYYFDLGNQAAVDALKSINKEQIPSILQPFANFTRLSARMVTTLLPGFGQVNTIRDVWERSENIRTRILKDYPDIDMSKVGKDAINIAFNALSPTNNLVKKMASVMLEGTKGGEYIKVDNNDPDVQLIREMLATGAGATWGDYFESTNKTLANQLQKSTKLTRKTIEYLNAYNNSFELISSFAVYKALKQNGVTDKNTAGAATLNLMNFNKSGTATGPLRALYMFVNPALQGAQQMGLTLSTKQGKARAAAYLIGGMALYTALRAMGGDDDDLGVNKMDSQSSFVTERNISIPIGNDEFIKVPVGFGMPQLMWSTATNLVKAMAGSQDGADTASEIIKSFMRVIAPVAPSETAITDHPIFWMAQSATPQIAKPLMNVGLGINAFGQPLTNSKFENPSVSRALQGRKSTPEEYKEMAQVLGRMGIKMYPEEVRELVNGYGLGPIREYIIKPMIENPNKEKLGRKTISTAVDRWVSAYDKSGLKERLYYRMVDEANEASIKKSLGSQLSPREQKLATLNDVVTKMNRKASGKLAASTKAEKSKKNGANFRKEGEKIKENAMNIMINGYKSLPE